MKAQCETGLVRQILDWLRVVKRWRAYRMNSGALRNPAGRLVFFGEEGMADIVALVPDGGPSLWCEVKMPGKEPTAKQLAFGGGIRLSGHVYCCVHSIAELEKVIEGLTT